MALWVLFTGSFRLSMSWLERRLVLAGLLGAVGGPLSYSAGQRMGACLIHPDFLHGYGSLGLIWGIVIPLLFRLSGALASAEKKRAGQPPRKAAPD